MSETVLFSLFHRLVNSRPHYKGRGFTNINCPSCGDKRKRGGFAPTPTGGFRYFCYNGGCEYNETPTGWEPGNGLGGRVGRLFGLLGGNFKEVPLRERFNQNHSREESAEIATHFPNIHLPGGSLPLLTALERFGDKVAPVVQYMYERGDFYLYEDYDKRFWWSPEMPTKVIIPFFHQDKKVVGYLGRDIYKSGPDRFVQKGPPDYLFNQHYLKSHDENHILVMESPMSAIPLNGLGTRANRLTKKQINLLRLSRKIPVLIPDYKGDEWQSYLHTAIEEAWPIAAPNWKYKDVGAAMKELGCLCVTKIIMETKTRDYKLAEATIKKNIMMMGR